MIAWSTLEDALTAWVRAATSLDADHVSWAQQKMPTPPGAYAKLRLGGVVALGQDWNQSVAAGSPAPGAELTMFSRGVRQVTLTIQVFAGAPYGSTMPVALLESIRAAAGLPGQRAALVAAGVGLARFLPAMSIDGVVGSSTFEPRGVMDVLINLASEVSETATYIETADLTDQIDGNEFSV